MHGNGIYKNDLMTLNENRNKKYLNLEIRMRETSGRGNHGGGEWSGNADNG